MAMKIQEVMKERRGNAGPVYQEGNMAGETSQDKRTAALGNSDSGRAAWLTDEFVRRILVKTREIHPRVGRRQPCLVVSPANEACNI